MHKGKQKKKRESKTYKHFISGTVADTANGVSQCVRVEESSIGRPYLAISLEISNSSPVFFAIITSYKNPQLATNLTTMV